MPSVRCQAVSVRHVLNAKKCRDNCIDHALESLQEIRRTLVAKQVQLSKATDGPLYLLIELMLGGIRQFLTCTEGLRDLGSNSALILPSDMRRPPESRKTYFEALETLRAHLYRCLAQVSVIANLDIPKIVAHMRYDDEWQVDAYKPPEGRSRSDVLPRLRKLVVGTLPVTSPTGSRWRVAIRFELADPLQGTALRLRMISSREIRSSV